MVYYPKYLDSPNIIDYPKYLCSDLTGSVAVFFGAGCLCQAAVATSERRNGRKPRSMWSLCWEASLGPLSWFQRLAEEL